MKRMILSGFGLLLAACSAPNEPVAAPVDQVSERPDPQTLEDRFAVLALDCVHRQYPNKISHVLQSDQDARTPRELTPVFYGDRKSVA